MKNVHPSALGEAVHAANGKLQGWLISNYMGGSFEHAVYLGEGDHICYADDYPLPTDKSGQVLKMTDERSGFNSLPISARLFKRTGIKWFVVFKCNKRDMTVYMPDRRSNPHKVRLVHLHRSRMPWRLQIKRKEIFSAASLKPLYPDIKRALNGEYSNLSTHGEVSADLLPTPSAQAE